MSTLPVRSPLPNRVPSTRSAPAMTANSAAATAVPRSLCGCTLRTLQSRFLMLRREPFDLVGIDIGCGHLDGGRKIENGSALRRRLPDRVDRVADLHGKIQFSPGKAFRAVFESPIGVGLLQSMFSHDAWRPEPQYR